MSLGFIGVGTIGEPMCRLMTHGTGLPMVATDRRREPLERLETARIGTADGVAEVARAADIVFMALPNPDAVKQVCLGANGLLETTRSGQTVVDCSTTPVALTRELAERFRQRGVSFADAPVSRNHDAAELGELNILVGAEPEIFQRIEPLLAHCAAHVTRCGGVGSGQVATLLNNMILLQTAVALAEALTVAREVGIDGASLFDALSKGAADGFALRHQYRHALRSGEFPRTAFSTEDAANDLSYTLKLAEAAGLRLNGADAVEKIFSAARAAGYGSECFPAVIKVIDPHFARR